MHRFIVDHKKTHIWRKCLGYFHDECKLLKHQLICLPKEPCIVKVPREDWVIFKPKKYIKALYLLETCEFECFNARLDLSEGSLTQKIYHPNPVAPGYYIIFDLPRVLKPAYIEYFGSCSVEWFVTETIKLEYKMEYHFKNTYIALNTSEGTRKNSFKPMRVGYVINLSHNQSQLQTLKNRDHCNPSGIYRNVALNPCSINAKQPKLYQWFFIT